MSLAQGQLTLASNNQPTCQIHPVVIFSILDAYKRRQPAQHRVIGTLLGERRGNRVIIRSAFPVPHAEDEESITVDMEYHEKMTNLLRQASPRDTVLGWFTTGNQLNFFSSLIHNVYRDQLVAYEPVLVAVDVSVAQLSMPVRVYTESRVSLNGAAIMASYNSVECEIAGSEEERIGVDAIIQGEPQSNDRLDAPSTLLTDDQQLERSIGTLYESLHICHAYVKAVQSGSIAGDAELAHRINAALQNIPHIDAKTFTATISTHTQDLMMILYLAQLAQTQRKIADKVNGLLL